MSIPANKTHLGFNVHIDELVEERTLTMRSATQEALKKVQDGVDWTIADLKKKLAQAEIQIAGLKKPEKDAK